MAHAPVVLVPLACWSVSCVLRKATLRVPRAAAAGAAPNPPNEVVPPLAEAPKAVEPKALAPKAGAEAGEAPKAGVDAAPKAEAPNAGWLAPKAGVDAAPNAGWLAPKPGAVGWWSGWGG